jgi:hypothetical protein
LKELLRGGESEIERIALETSVGMAFSNVIAFFIILTTAAVRASMTLNSLIPAKKVPVP